MESHKNEFESNTENLENSNEVHVHAHPGDKVIVEMEKAEDRDAAVAEMSADIKEFSKSELKGKDPSQLTDTLNAIKYDRSKKVETFTPDPNYKHIPERQHVKGFRKFLFGLAVMLGMAGAANAEGGKNPADSTEKAKMENMIREIESHKEVNDVIRNDWNEYLKWLDSKGLKGSPTLDHSGMGMKMLKEYVDTHPGTSLEASEEGVKQIQAEFIKYRRWVLDEAKAGRAQLTPGVTEKNFMSWLSKYDGIPGQFTTQSKFPEAKEIKTEKTVYNDGTGKVDQKTTVTNKGFAKIGKDYSGRDDTATLTGAEIAKNK